MQSPPPPDPHMPMQHVAPVFPQYPPPPPPPRRRSRTPLWVGLGAVVVLALAAVAGTMLRQSASTPDVPAGVRATVSPWASPPALDTPSPAEPAPTAGQQVYEGTGGDVVQLRQPVRLGIVRFECALCTASATVISDSPASSYVVQHLSGGPYVGTRWIGVRGGTTTSFTVAAQGPWQLTVGGLDMVRQVDGATTTIGTGDDVVLMRRPPAGMQVSHTGKSNFVVQLVTDHSQGGPSLLVNEIGQYTGSVPLGVVPGDAALVQVSADGDWTFIPG